MRHEPEVIAAMIGRAVEELHDALLEVHFSSEELEAFARLAERDAYGILRLIDDPKYSDRTSAVRAPGRVATIPKRRPQRLNNPSWRKQA